MKEEKIVIYTNNKCSACKELKTALKEEKIKFIEKDIDNHEKEWNKVQSITHMSTTPTILFKNSYFVPERDFNHHSQVIGIIKYYVELDLNNNNIMLERMKTLNYSIATAFGSIDRAIRAINTKLGEGTCQQEHK
jgi:glutaredoxin